MVFTAAGQLFFSKSPSSSDSGGPPTSPIHTKSSNSANEEVALTARFRKPHRPTQDGLPHGGLISRAIRQYWMQRQVQERHGEQFPNDERAALTPGADTPAEDASTEVTSTEDTPAAVRLAAITPAEVPSAAVTLAAITPAAVTPALSCLHHSIIAASCQLPHGPHT